MSELPSAFTDLVGCALPLQLAPMGGGVGTPELAAAVCNAGGLGMVSSFGPAPLADQIASLRAQTTAPYGVGFFGFDLTRSQADLDLAASQTRVVDIFWGDPDAAIVRRIHAGGALAMWQVGTAEEAFAAVDAGCDAVVVQGVEAGGHVRGTTPLRTLLDQVVPATNIPVVAAGGLTTAEHVRRVLDAGAAAIRVGTRLLATTESGAHPAYLAALVAAGFDDTELTTAFDGGWPNAPHRVLRGALSAAAQANQPTGWLKVGEQQFPIDRWSAIPPTKDCSGEIDAMALYAGQGVGDVTEVLGVAEVIKRLFGHPS